MLSAADLLPPSAAPSLPAASISTGYVYGEGKSVYGDAKTYSDDKKTSAHVYGEAYGSDKKHGYATIGAVSCHGTHCNEDASKDDDAYGAKRLLLNKKQAAPKKYVPRTPMYGPPPQKKSESKCALRSTWTDAASCSPSVCRWGRGQCPATAQHSSDRSHIPGLCSVR
jgi:hypothetical protein